MEKNYKITKKFGRRIIATPRVPAFRFVRDVMQEIKFEYIFLDQAQKEYSCCNTVSISDAVDFLLRDKHQYSMYKIEDNQRSFNDLILSVDMATLITADNLELKKSQGSIYNLRECFVYANDIIELNGNRATVVFNYSLNGVLYPGFNILRESGLFPFAVSNDTEINVVGTVYSEVIEFNKSCPCNRCYEKDHHYRAIDLHSRKCERYNSYIDGKKNFINQFLTKWGII